MATGLAVLLVGACGSEVARSNRGLVFEPTRIDLGERDEWEVPTARFPFHNHGEREVTIARVVGACACSSLEVLVGTQSHRAPGDGTGGPVVVPPGASGMIVATASLRGVRGERTLSVRCDSNDPSQPSSLLQWRVRPRPYAVIEPAEIVIDDVDWESAVRFAATVTPNERWPFRIVGHDPLPDGWRIDLSAESDGPRVYRVAGTCEPRLARDRLSVSIRLWTDGPIPEVSLPVVVNVRRAFTVDPGDFITLSTDELRAGRTLSVVVTSVDGRPVECRGVRLLDGTHPESQVVWTWPTSGSPSIVLQACVAPIESAGVLRMRYEVRLEHPYEPDLSLTILGFARPKG